MVGGMRTGLVVVVLVAGLGFPGGVRAADAPELSYRFELVRSPALAVRVHATLPGGPDGTTTLEVDAEWGGVRAGGEDIGDVTVTDASGNTLVATRPAPNQIVVTHAPGATLSVTYSLAANDHQVQMDPGESRRPIVNAHLFRMVGHLGLLRPAFIDDQTPCTVHIGWDGFDAAGWRVVSSWGAGTGERTVTTTLVDFEDALYLAGDIRLITRDVHGYPLTITVAGGGWTFTPDAFADQCVRVVKTERAFFDDFANDFYWISLVPTGPVDQKGRNIGGTGLLNCFSLSVGPNTVLVPDDGSESIMIAVLAHEMFHEWNGHIIRREDPEELLYWFSEGFTDFYARRLRFRGGIIDARQYAASVTQTLERYATSPVRDEPNQRILADFWNDRDVQKLPYYRGDIVAMMLDAAIRRASGGTKSLDDVMRALVIRARAGAVVSMESLFATFSEYADSASLTTIRALVENGGLPALGNLFAPCLSIEPAEAARYDVGFDLTQSMKDKKIVGLREGSAAEAAGLKNGMTLDKWSIYNGDVTRPIELTIIVDGQPREISYYPKGDSVPAFRATVTGSHKDCASL
jgi:predicted metalloprotease with PDZ domain